MAATTPIMSLPYPVDTDNPGTLAVHTAIQNLATTFDAFFGAWTTWTPQIDQGGTTNIAKTNNNSRWRSVGKFFEFEMRVTMTAGGTASNKITFTLPVTCKNTGLLLIGWGSVNDVSATSDYQRGVYLDTSSATKGIWLASGGAIGANTMTAALASGDILTAVGFGEAQ